MAIFQDTPNAPSLKDESPIPMSVKEKAMQAYLRSHKKVPMVRREIDRVSGKELIIRDNLPVGLGWNRDGTILEHKTIAGWMTEDEFLKEENAKQREAIQKAELAKAELAVAEAEAEAEETTVEVAPIEDKPKSKGKK